MKYITINSGTDKKVATFRVDEEVHLQRLLFDNAPIYLTNLTYSNDKIGQALISKKVDCRNLKYVIFKVLFPNTTDVCDVVISLYNNNLEKTTYQTVSLGNTGYYDSDLKMYDSEMVIVDVKDFDFAIFKIKTDIVNEVEIMGGGSKNQESFNGYVFGGGTVNDANIDIKWYQQYFVSADSWITKHNIPSTHFSFPLDGQFVLGIDFTTFVLSPELDMFFYKTAMPSPARHCVDGMEIKNNGFVVGGNAGIGAGWNVMCKDTDSYILGLDSWSGRTDINSPERRLYGATSIGNKGYIICGQAPSGFLRDMEEYQIDFWTSKLDKPSPNVISNHGAGQIKDKAYLIGGYMWDTEVYKDIYEFDPSGNTWTKKTDMLSPARTSHATISLNNGIYLVYGSDGTKITNGNYYNQTEFYQNDTWVSKADAPLPLRCQSFGDVL